MKYLLLILIVAGCSSAGKSECSKNDPKCEHLKAHTGKDSR